MTENTTISPWRVLLPVSLGTALSLIGDASLYTVLPTHGVAAGVPLDVTIFGVSLASLGILLSANRFIRLILNGPAGLAYDRWPRRWLFLPALFIGACSTAIYALTRGFWPLLAGRLLWGLAWAGIWVGGNTIILDISHDDDRGRRVGLYQISFFLGTASGAVLGGLLTDWLGYHRAMGTGAVLTLLGALVALVFLPETRGLRAAPAGPVEAPDATVVAPQSSRRRELASATALMGVNRVVMAGILVSTFGLFLKEQLGDSIQVGGRSIGVATLTGLGLGLSTLTAMVAAPIMGRLSDRASTRWQAVAGGLAPGVAGFGLLASGAPVAILAGLPMAAATSGSNQGLSTALVGDLSGRARQGRLLGLLFTTGDLGSAIGPPLAYALIPSLGLSGIYSLSAGLFAAMLLVALGWAIRRN